MEKAPPLYEATNSTDRALFHDEADTKRADKPSTALSRREVITGACLFAGMMVIGGATKALAFENNLLRPPGGQDSVRLKACCIRCDRCRTVCPTGCVSVSSVSDGWLDARTPKLDFHRGYCIFCNRCIEVCPTGALVPFDPVTDKLGIAYLDTSSCIAYTVGSCDRCRNSCAFDALSFSNSGLPSIDALACNGCGACVDACVVNVYRAFNGSSERAIEVLKEGALR
jgi:ferredoxin-type protein NapG